MGADAGRLLRESPWPELPIDSEDWSQRTWATVIDIWLRLIRETGLGGTVTPYWNASKLYASRKSILKHTISGTKSLLMPNRPLWKLVGLYHLTKAAEIFATYLTDGVVEGHYQIHQLLDTQFDRVFAVCQYARILEMDPLSRLLAACSSKMAENSIWTVTRAVKLESDPICSKPGGSWQGRPCHFRCPTATAANVGRKRLARIESAGCRCKPAYLERQDFNSTVSHTSSVESV